MSDNSSSGKKKKKQKEDIFFNATCLSSSLRGFSTMLEMPDNVPKKVVEELNEYLTIMYECIKREEGIMVETLLLHKIVAAFRVPIRLAKLKNAAFRIPIRLPAKLKNAAFRVLIRLPAKLKNIASDDHEDRGIRTAISMIKTFQTWNKQRIADDRNQLDMSIGLNTDTVFNWSSIKNMKHTLTGKGVKFGIRLDRACRLYSAHILISENTYLKLQGIYSIREIDRVIVKDQTKAVKIYEVLDYHTPETFPNMEAVINLFKEGLIQYRKQQWKIAIQIFGEALKLNQGDSLSNIYIKRCEYFQAVESCDYFQNERLHEDWDGIWYDEWDDMSMVTSARS